MEVGKETNGWVGGTNEPCSDMSTPEKSRASTDLIVLAILSIVVLIIAIKLELFEKIIGWTVQYEDWEVDELLCLLIILPVALAIFALRRWREYRHELTRRIQADEALQRSHSELENRFKEKTKDLLEVKERLYHIFSSNPAVIYTAEPGGDFATTFMSENITSQLGYEPRGFLEDSSFWSTHVHPEDVQGVLEGLSPLFEQGHHVHEYRFRHKDGSYRWMRDELNLVRDENGTPVEIIGYWIDITDRKNAEAALVESEDRLKLAIEGANLGLWDWDLKTGQGVLNEQSRVMFGYPPGDLRTDLRRWKSMVHPEDWPKVSEAFNGHLDGRLPAYEAEFRLRCESGEWKWIIARGKITTCDTDGKPLRMVGTILDINNRRQTEEELRIRDKAIRTSVTGIGFATPDGTLSFANDAWLRMWGFHDLGEAVGSHISKFAHDQDAFSKQFEMFQEKGFILAEMQGRRKDATIFQVQFSASMVPDDSGKPLCLMASFIDISDRKRAEEALRESNAKLDGIIAALTDHMSIIDEEHNIVWANDTAKRLFGTDLVGKKCYSAYHRREAVCESCLVSRAFADGNLQEHEVEVVSSDGTIMSFWCTATVTSRHEDGRPKLVLEISRDITERKRAEEALRKAKGELELRVQERTAELKTLNEDLLREIAERNAAEQALRESEERYRGLVENSNDIVYQIDTKGFFTFVNRSACRISGYSEEELVGRHFTDLIPPEYREETAKFYGRQCAKRMPSTYYEFPFMTKNRDVKWVGQNVQSLMKEDEIVGFQAITRDITERKRVEEALRESEEKFRFLAEHATDVLWTLDLNLRTTYVSPSIERVVGFTPEERMKQDVRDQLTPESFAIAQNRLVEELRRDREEGIGPDEYVVLDLDYLHKDGSVVCLESVVNFIREESGNPIGIYGLSRDVTERRKSEEALRKSEEFNRRLVEYAPFGIAYLSGDGAIEYVNPAANAIMGVPEGRVSPVLGGNILELPGLKDRSEVEDGFHGLIKGKSLSDLEVAYKSSAGIDTELLVAATPRVDSDGTVAGAVLMFTDISERKRAEELQRETARFRAVADLAGGVAHNFNNLLQVVIGYLELALIDLEMGNYADIKDALEKVLESSRFGAETVRRLQSFAGIRDRSRVPEREVFDLSGIVRQAVEMTKTWWKTIPEQQGRRVCLDIHLQDGCLVQGEKNDLFEVMVNLIKNATEALPQDGTIDVETCVEGDQVILKVRDTGIGISQENLERLFNPFFTTKANARSGLGLASSRKIIEDCGGKILVESKEAQGTTFTTFLPLVKEEPEPPKTEKTPAIGQQLTVLVIDDDEAIVDLLKNALTRHNCKVFTASSGEKGLDIFKETRVELVVCDLGMPGMNGWAVGTGIRAICQERRIEKTPFILLTGWGGQKTEAEKIAESGVDAVVEKPLNIKNMLEVVREVVEKGRSGDAQA